MSDLQTPISAKTPKAAAAPATSDKSTDTTRGQAMTSRLRGASFADGAAMVRPAQSAEPAASAETGSTQTAPASEGQPAPGGSGLGSPRFQGKAPFEETLAGGRRLKWGNCNGEVTRSLQEALGACSHDPGGVDGIWGPKTQGAVLSFQRGAGLGADGIIGPLTMRALDQADLAGGSGQGRGEAGAQTDPRLRHNSKVENGEEVDPESPKGKSLARLPYNGSDVDDGWHGEWIVSNWSQIDDSPVTSTDTHRCAANASIAPRILAGPIAFADYAESLFVASQRVIAKTKPSADLYYEMVAKSASLGLVGSMVRMRMATWGSLDLVAECAKLFLTSDPLGATQGQESAAMQQLAADPLTSRYKIPQSVAEVNELCDELGPGESWLVQVDTDVLTPGERPDVSQVDHFVTVGRRGEEVYLYDPWPRAGSQMVYRERNRGDFMNYFVSAHGEMKYAEFLSRTTPRTT